HRRVADQMERKRPSSARTTAVIAALILLACGHELLSQAGQAPTPPAPPADSAHYHPAFHPPPAIEAIERFLPAGSDGFPEEKTAEVRATELNTLGAAVRQRPGSIGAAAGTLLGPQFRGGRFVAGESDAASGALEIAHAGPSPAATLHRTRFQQELAALVAGFRTVDVAEFLITRIETEAAGAARTIVRFGLSGTEMAGGRGR